MNQTLDRDPSNERIFTRCSSDKLRFPFMTWETKAADKSKSRAKARTE